MNILIVDDSRAMRMLVKRMVKTVGMEGDSITEAEDGEKALEHMRGDVPDLVLSDWNMPNMTGIELLQNVNKEGISTTFGFITTESTHEMRTSAAEAGAKFLITKPFTEDSFSAAIKPYM